MKTQAHVRELLKQIQYNNTKAIIASANGNTDVALRHRQRIKELEQEIVDMYEDPDLTEWVSFEHINEFEEHQRLWGYYFDGSIRPGVVQCWRDNTKFLDTLDGEEFHLPLNLQPIYICVRDVFDQTPPAPQAMRIKLKELATMMGISEPAEVKITKWGLAKNWCNHDSIGLKFNGFYPDGLIRPCIVTVYNSEFLYYFRDQNIILAHEFQPWYVTKYIEGAEGPAEPISGLIRMVMNENKSWQLRLLEIVTRYGDVISELTGLNIPVYQIEKTKSGFAKKWCKTILKHTETKEGIR